MNELLLAIFKDIDTHIKAVVDKRVAEIMSNHQTVATINEDFEAKMREIAKHELDKHGAENSHYERNDIYETAQEAIDDYDFSTACGEIVDEKVDSRLDEVLDDAITNKIDEVLDDAITDKLDEVLDDAITEKLNDTKFVITGGTITTEV
jgi:hypothetical protein